MESEIIIPSMRGPGHHCVRRSLQPGRRRLPGQHVLVSGPWAHHRELGALDQHFGGSEAPLVVARHRRPVGGQTVNAHLPRLADLDGCRLVGAGLASAFDPLAELDVILRGSLETADRGGRGQNMLQHSRERKVIKFEGEADTPQECRLRVRGGRPHCGRELGVLADQSCAVLLIGRAGDLPR
jgi:hypothetical protein